MSVRSTMDARMKSDVDIQPVVKKSKTQPLIDLPSSVIAVFINQDGERAGNGPVDLPVGSSTKQLEMLINALLEVLFP